MKQGIVLLAIGAKEYGIWARSMAISLAYYSPDIPVLLVYEEKAVSSINLMERFSGKMLFDIRKKIDTDDCYDNGKLAPGKAKLSINRYTDFDETLYLDVDGLALQDTAPLFDNLKHGTFFAHTLGFGKKGDTDWGYRMMWAKPGVVYEHFGLTDKHIYPFINSSCIVWKGNGHDIFTLGRKLLVENPLPVQKMNIKWGKFNQPDELYFNAALALKNVNPEMPENPIYFRSPQDRGTETNDELTKDYYFLGLWGDKDQNHYSNYKYYDQKIAEFLLEGQSEYPYANKAHQLMRHKFVKTN